MARPFRAPEDIMLPPSPPEPIDAPNDESYNHGVEQTTSQHYGIASSMASIADAAPQLHIPPPRTRSPLAKAHFRSRSFAGSPAAPCMTRAHSSPGLDSRGRYSLAGSQVRHDLPLRRPSPLRTSSEETTYPAINGLNISEPISEQPELQGVNGSPKAHLEVVSLSGSLSPGIHSTFPRVARRRPSSPLNPSSTTSTGCYRSSSPSPSQSNLVMSARFNEPYPSYSFSSSSSMPSTPSSVRSRSPSISSLETIPDIPDAEAAAIEADRIAKLKAAADKADESAASTDPIRRRSALDIQNSSNPRFGLSRKRWSVCGAEGRQDLDLETIWED
ncbi:predicted protein [Uncinocarpus reesii 1704]|uniref:Basic proline-rich protein n=1 Tax=Uncinocarpus reesii (strain UAMH 1704) TaxID=336963 RepID=C4JPV3_UNCRE|nr:uncharacterized protein UREG_04596 [Uncinocarpus reesii 1704]EEP79750.1 predicted protein [Uncinocarpus reesii 1704]